MRFCLIAACTVVLLASSLFAQSPDLAEKSHHAKDLMAAQQFEQAVPIYRELVRALPGNPGIVMNLGLALVYSGHKREALGEFEKVLKLEPSSGLALLFLGTTYLDLGEAARALPPLEKLAKAEPENREDGAEAIHPVNLFPFLIRAAGISDGNLKNARATLGELDGNLRLDFKTLADKRDAFQQCRSNHLVTGFHIGEIEVRNDIAQQGQETISKLMTEEKNTTVFAGEEARTKNGVGLLVQENPNHFEEIERMIFEIRIMNDRQLRVRAN